MHFPHDTRSKSQGGSLHFLHSVCGSRKYRGWAPLFEHTRWSSPSTASRTSAALGDASTAELLHGRCTRDHSGVLAESCLDIVSSLRVREEVLDSQSSICYSIFTIKYVNTKQYELLMK